MTIQNSIFRRNYVQPSDFTSLRPLTPAYPSSLNWEQRDIHSTGEGRLWERNGLIYYKNTISLLTLITFEHGKTYEKALWGENVPTK